jgi:hypothetical protein
MTLGTTGHHLLDLWWTGTNIEDLDVDGIAQYVIDLQETKTIEECVSIAEHALWLIRRYDRMYARDRGTTTIIDVERQVTFPLPQLGERKYALTAKIDKLLHSEQHGGNIFMDHKFVGKQDQADWLDIAPQFSIYHLALRETGVDVVCSLLDSVYCVPLDTQALTKERGWVSQEQLDVGDEILAYNRERGVTDWTEVKELAIFPQAEVLTTVNRSVYQRHWSTRSTANHRWPCKREAMVRGELRWIDDWVTTEEAGKQHRRLILSAPYNAPTTSPLTPSEAAVVAWILTDGSISVRKGKQTVEARITQSKFPEEVRRALIAAELDFTEYTKWDVFSLRSAQMKVLWKKAGLTFENPAEHLDTLILALDRSALESFVEAAQFAEGSTYHRTFYQNPGLKADAFRLAQFLVGHLPGPQLPHNENCTRWSVGNPYKSNSTLRNESLTTVEPVWCPRTKWGTWVARWSDGTIAITGNTYQRSAKKEKLAWDAYPVEESFVRALVDRDNAMLDVVAEEAYWVCDRMWHLRQGHFQPVRSISPACMWCEFRAPCFESLRGDDQGEKAVLQEYFSERQKAPPVMASSLPEGIEIN